ncbi:AgmX/PglI C-terminal domain-containing protein [bacterium]|nr:AgmX/PglI C-terminal domain-containing protein [bacterium]NUN46676.1 AgmX/PglI C-terminal domain-containing protein [bacterium]
MNSVKRNTKAAAAPPGGARAAGAARDIRIVAFPKEFQKSYWSAFDKRMLGIFFISLVVVYTPLIYMAMQPPRPKPTVLDNKLLKAIAKINKVDAALLEELDKPKEEEKTEETATSAVPSAQINRQQAPTNAQGRATRAAAAKAAAAARAGAAAKAAAGRGVLAVAGAVGSGGGGRYAAVDFSGGSGNLDEVLGQVGGIGEATGGGGDRTVLGAGGVAGGTGSISDLTAELGGAGALSVAAGSAGSGLIGVGKASISGTGGGQGASAAEIQGVIDQNATSVNACYQKELKKSPDLKGKLSVSIKINQAGRVSGVSVTQNTVGDAVANCVTNKIRGWTFPRGKKGVVTVNQTFVFTK